MPINCWWVLKKIGGAVARHHHHHRHIGRGLPHAHHAHHAATAHVAKVLVCAVVGGGLGWSSTWETGAAGEVGAAAPAPFYGEVGPSWWSGGIAPELFTPSPISAEAFTHTPISTNSGGTGAVSDTGNGAEEAFGHVIARGESGPAIEIGFFVPKAPGEQHPVMEHPQQIQTQSVAEPGSVCVLISALGLLSLARLICRQ
jgi:hypothetical protein